jgi:CHAD domain-containing protein
LLRGPGNLALPKLRKAFGPGLHLDLSTQSQGTLTLWDGVGSELWGKGRLLAQMDSYLALHERDGDWFGPEVANGPWESAESEMMKVGALSPGRLAEEVARILGEGRTLKPFVAMSWDRQSFEVRNAVGKIVYRFDWVALSNGDAGDVFFHLLLARPLRGYGQAAERARCVFEAIGASPLEPGPLSEYFKRHPETAPRLLDLQPRFGLHAEQPARHALRLIIREMLDIAVRHEPGIIEDENPEFLHHYRVCLRKIRSVFGLLKNVFPEEREAFFKETFGDLARATNSLRDLDVYLMSRDAYVGMLPEAFRPGLAILFEDYAARRERERAKVCERLGSAEYAEQMSSLEKIFVEADADPATPEGAMAVGPAVRARMLRQYRRILKFWRTRGAEATDAELHELRIHGKKLRYLMEFFAELLPESAEALEKQLRRLQNRLGLFNDYAVQQRSLLAYWQRHRTRPPELALALGGLVSVLHDRQRAERAELNLALETFCSAPTEQAFKELA